MALNAEQTSTEVFPWLKTLPLAPEYHPTLSEFQDPISYIFKIEPDASKYGICKIVPPVPPNPKKTAITNLNRSLAARAGTPKSSKSLPTFTTRQQQIGFCPRKPRPVQRPVWQSGERYTFGEFETKAKAFEKGYLNKRRKKPLSPLEIETLYWKASVDKPFSVEYANDMPGSAFAPVNTKKCREAGEAVTLGDTAWNMRGVSRAKGSLLRFMKEEIPGVTSPMVYVAMMFSWFAWHVEDHDLHSLNYMHMGGGKTWYGVPREAAFAFEEVVRVHGYGGEINPLVTFATLSEKTTVMSPEVFLKAGIPCCRLVQNAGEFVVTFPRAYHSGFSHGFNCGEAANIATPEWLRFAKDAAIRRASINYPPMVSHFQLLYDLALALSSRASISDSAEPRSSRLKDKKKGEGETLVKELFVKSVIHNNDLLHTLGEGSSVVILPQNSSDISVRSNLQVGSSLKVKPRLYLGLCNQEESRSLVSNRIILDGNKGGKHIKGYYLVKEKFTSSFENNKLPSLRGDGDENTFTSQTWNIDTERDSTAKGDGFSLSDQRLFSCTKCGLLNYTCVAIVQPKEEAARYLMSADCSILNDLADDSEGNTERFPLPSQDENTCKLKASSERTAMAISDGLYDIPVQSSDYEIQGAHQGDEVVSDIEAQEDTSTTALSLLALNYGNSSDSEDDQAEPDASDFHDKMNGRNFTPESRYQYSNSALSSPNQDLDEVPPEINSTECSVQFETGDLASIERNSTEYTFTDLLTHSNFSYPNVPLESRPHDDSSRMHVFCLEHAVEVEQQLRQIGGVHISLLCHPDYPRLEDEAKLVAEELKFDHEWKDVLFRDATREDEDRIQSALDSEEAVPGNGDWAVKLGINLYYSAILSRSALYSKQMPYNSVIYKAFGFDSQAKSQSKPKVFYGKRPTRQKKIVVAGKWCGKVWMSNQVHPLLLLKESDGKEQEQVFEEKSFHARPDFDEKPERKSKTTLQYSRKAGNKRKMAKDCLSIKKAKIQDRDTYSDNSLEYCPPQRDFRPVKKVTIQDHDTYSDDSMEDDSPPQQEFRSIKNSKNFPEYDDLDIDTTHDDSPEDSPPLPGRRSLRSKQKKEESPPPPQKKSKQNFKSFDDSYNDDDLEGGPSTRLRKRKTKPQKDPVSTPVIKKEIIEKKARKSSLANKGVKIKDEKMTNEGGNYLCDLDGCNMTFGSKQELVVHKRNICPVRGCGKKFFSHKYLVQHRRVHLDDRPLKCPWKGCKMTFKWAWSRTEHIRVHTGARPYVCGESGCGQTFRFVSDFSRHKRKTGHSRKKAKARGVK